MLKLNISWTHLVEYWAFTHVNCGNKQYVNSFTSTQFSRVHTVFSQQSMSHFQVTRATSKLLLLHPDLKRRLNIHMLEVWTAGVSSMYIFWCKYVIMISRTEIL